MIEAQRQALLWAICATPTDDFSEQERVLLTSAQQRLNKQQSPTPAEYRVLADVALCAGTLMVAGFAGLAVDDLAAAPPTLADLEAAQAYCEARDHTLAAV